MNWKWKRPDWNLILKRMKTWKSKIIKVGTINTFCYKCPRKLQIKFLLSVCQNCPKGFSNLNNINPKIWDLGSYYGGPSKGGLPTVEMAKFGLLAAGEGIILSLLLSKWEDISACSFNILR